MLKKIITFLISILALMSIVACSSGPGELVPDADSFLGLDFPDDGADSDQWLSGLSREEKEATGEKEEKDQLVDDDLKDDAKIDDLDVIENDPDEEMAEAEQRPAVDGGVVVDDGNIAVGDGAGDPTDFIPVEAGDGGSPDEGDEPVRTVTVASGTIGTSQAEVSGLGRWNTSGLDSENDEPIGDLPAEDSEHDVAAETHDASERNINSQDALRIMRILSSAEDSEESAVSTDNASVLMGWLEDVTAEPEDPVEPEQPVNEGDVPGSYDQDFALDEEVLLVESIENMTIEIYTGEVPYAQSRNHPKIQFCGCPNDSCLDSCVEVPLINRNDLNNSDVDRYSIGNSFYLNQIIELMNDNNLTSFPYFRVSLSNTYDDGWVFEGIKIRFSLGFNYGQTRSKIYWNPCVHRWMNPGQEIKFSENDTAVCTRVYTGNTNGAGTKDRVKLNMDSSDDRESISNNDYILSYSPHFVYDNGHNSMNLDWSSGEFSDNQRNQIVSYGDYFYNMEFSALGSSLFWLEKANRNGSDGWYLDRIKIYAFQPAKSFSWSPNNEISIDWIYYVNEDINYHGGHGIWLDNDDNCQLIYPYFEEFENYIQLHRVENYSVETFSTIGRDFQAGIDENPPSRGIRVGR